MVFKDFRAAILVAKTSTYGIYGVENKGCWHTKIDFIEMRDLTHHLVSSHLLHIGPVLE